MGFGESYIKKEMAKVIYTKITKVLTKTELEHFDICKDEINRLIYEREAKTNNRKRSSL